MADEINIIPQPQQVIEINYNATVVEGATGPTGPTGPQGEQGPAGLGYNYRISGAGSGANVGTGDKYISLADDITQTTAYVVGNRIRLIAPASGSWMEGRFVSLTPSGSRWILRLASDRIFVSGGSTYSDVWDMTLSGEKGDTGPTGPQGLSGYSGAVGPTGPQGEIGPQGPEGLSGYSGAQGPQGEQGISGYSGAVGAQGPQGEVGPTGPQGEQGISGYSGYSGPQGPQGEAGPQGPAGADGLSGYSGAKGDTGETGPTGPQGEQGIQGPAGADGLSGYSGWSGYSGAQGPQGEVGPQGEAGPAGADGLSGYSGYSGAQGEPGIQGEAGPQGPEGISGYSGYSGAQGETGPQGEPGISADQGLNTTDSVAFAGLTVAGLSYPAADGTSGQVLTTDGAGTLSWQDGGSGGNPFDQDLNTTDSPEFAAVKVAGIDLTGLSEDTLQITKTTLVESGGEGEGTGDPLFDSVAVLLKGYDFVDSSTNGYSVVSNGDTYISGSPQAMHFHSVYESFGDSADDSVVVLGSNNIVYGSSPFTIDFWVFPTDNSQPGIKTIAGQWGGDKGWLIQGGNESDNYDFIIWPTGGNITFVNFGIPNQQWSHIAIQRIAEYVVVFVNGTFANINYIGTSDLIEPLSTANVTLFVNNDGPQQPFAGRIENFRITLAERYPEWTLFSITVPQSADDYNDFVPGDPGTMVEVTNPASLAMERAEVNEIKFADQSVQTTAYTGPSNPFDQSLNTTDNVTFNQLEVTSSIRTPQINRWWGVDKLILGAELGSTIEVGGVMSDIGDKITITAGAVAIQGLTYPSADGTSGQVLTTDGAGSLSWTDKNPFDQELNSTSDVNFNNLTVQGHLNLKSVSETVYDWGNVAAGTYTPDASTGTVHKMVLTGNVTINSLANVYSGSNVTLILQQDATGSRTLTSSMKFAGGEKTLSTAANSIDILSIFYDGTNYYASLVKGYA